MAEADSEVESCAFVLNCLNMLEHVHVNIQAALVATTALGGGLGAHMTASIGGADMPVVITLLNCYSGCVQTLLSFWRCLSSL